MYKNQTPTSGERHSDRPLTLITATNLDPREIIYQFVGGGTAEYKIRGHVLIIGAPEDLDTLKKGVLAAGGDGSKIQLLSQVLTIKGAHASIDEVRLPDDVETIAAQVANDNIGLIVIDHIDRYFDDGASIEEGLDALGAPLAWLHAQTGAVMLATLSPAANAAHIAATPIDTK
jgi:hypothetical protein